MPSFDDLSPRRRAMFLALDRIGRWYNGFEVHGMEHLPLDRPALLVFYHGFIPLDGWYFAGYFTRRTGRVIHGLGDRFLFKTPGLERLVRATGAVEGTRENALALLRAGELVGVSPGGVREAIAPREHHYELFWGHRTGFAEVAIEAGVDVICGFTENVEELYRSPFVGARPVQALYEATRIPIVPVVGLGLLPFPVKLRTWIAPPIRYDPARTVDGLVAACRGAIEGLIDEHQGGGPRILRGLAARFGGSE